jgi:hypothetical protein
MLGQFLAPPAGAWLVLEPLGAWLGVVWVVVGVVGVVGVVAVEEVAALAIAAPPPASAPVTATVARAVLNR